MATHERPGFLRRFWLWILLALVVAACVLGGLYTWLRWNVLQVMYRQKAAGLDWFNTVFYHGYTFILAALLALLVLNPLPGRSDIYGVWEAFQRLAREQFAAGPGMPTFSLRGLKIFWALWQLVKWAAAFAVVASLNGVPFFGNVTTIFYMTRGGLGSWALVPRIFALPIVPASGSEIISLMPTMEVQYRLLYVVSATVLTIAAVRMFLKLVRHFIMGQQNTWIRDTFALLTCIMVAIVLGAPYWRMDATTPFDYAICLILLFSFLVATLFFQFVGLGGDLSFAKRRRLVFTVAAGGIIALLGVNAAIVAGYRLNWNNNWIEYEWRPLTEKQIGVTRWTAGIEEVEQFPLTQVPSGDTDKILSLVRQWDSGAAYDNMKNQLGPVGAWAKLADSDIVYIPPEVKPPGREYWVAPTTFTYPSQDWISIHQIYTHTSKIMVMDSHSGEFLNVTDAFGVKREPLFYYGEGFDADVYPGIKGAPPEVDNVTYSGEPDYVLSGWQRALWFLLQGQVGFAFTPPQESINLLHRRDVIQRVQGVLIDGLSVDPDVYLVTDGEEKVYYAAQVCINYPIHSGFSAGNYLRYFAVVLVDVEDGSMQGYIVGKPDGFLVDFYSDYYSAWKNPLPEWLEAQMRYPEALLGRYGWPGQLDIDFYYHVDEPSEWRGGSRFYERPPETEVLYILVEGQNETRFAGLQIVEYLGSEGKNLAGIYLAYGGARLGEVNLYPIPNATLLGPTAARTALEVNDKVREKLTLLGYPDTARTGNILLYAIGHKLYYFIPVYQIVQGAQGVVVNKPFVGIVDSTTSGRVSWGLNADDAYYALTGSRPAEEEGAEARLNRTRDIFISGGYQLVSPTAKPTANVEIQVRNITYLGEGQWNQTEEDIRGFIDYVKGVPGYNGTDPVYWWSTDPGVVNFGFLISDRGIVQLLYISVRYR